MSFTYPPIVTDSNFNPIALRVKREGVLLPALGVTVQVNVKDRDTGAVIVEDGVATSVGDGRWEYRFSPEQVALIVANSMWLVEWTIMAGGYTWRSNEPALLPVRKRL
jgi:hypothetical protein